MCDCGLNESVFHIIVECEAYEQEQNKLMQTIISEMGNELFMRWDESEVENMCTLLGIGGNVNFRVTEAMKEFIVSAWKIRSLHDEALASRIVRREHAYSL